MKCLRGQVIIAEGTPCTKLIIVSEGEFLVRKTINNDQKKKKLEPRRDEIEFLEDVVSHAQNSDQKNYQINMSLLGKGQLFGEDDLIQD